MGRRFILCGLLVALVAAGGAQAARFAGLPSPNLPAGWSHASINVVIKRVPHTLTYDHGRVMAVTGSSLTLREPDGSVVTVAISPSADVRIAGQPTALTDIRRLEQATTISVDGSPAAVVKVTIPAAIARILKRGGG